MKIMDRLSLSSLSQVWSFTSTCMIHDDLLTSLCCHGGLVLDSVSELSSNQFIAEQKKTKIEQSEECAKGMPMVDCYLVMSL